MLRAFVLAFALLGVLAGAPARAGGPELVAFASEEGMARLARAGARQDFATLANHFEAQYNNVFCGPATATVVLNALSAGRPTAPRDTRRFAPGDTKHLPAGADISLPRFTQDIVIERGAKTRSQVLGEPMPVGGRLINDFGYQLAQLEEMLRANGARVRRVVVDDARPEAAVRADLVDNLARGGDYVVVNYVRRAVGQQGGGHFSPLGAYDAASDSFLLLDVNPTAAGWVWIPAPVLIGAMRTFDTLEHRGYLLVAPAAE